nr:MAG TPA: hypothetical protein [Caudoviricetes sp.]
MCLIFFKIKGRRIATSTLCYSNTNLKPKSNTY